MENPSDAATQVLKIKRVLEFEFFEALKHNKIQSTSTFQAFSSGFKLAEIIVGEK